MSKSIAYKHQLRALARWPKDALRPDIQFQDAIRRRLDCRLGLTVADANDTKSASAAPPNPIAPIWKEGAELEQASFLYSLAVGRYSRKYPLNKLLTPASNPTYYEDLARELDAAPRRTWWGSDAVTLEGFLEV